MKNKEDYLKDKLEVNYCKCINMAKIVSDILLGSKGQQRRNILRRNIDLKDAYKGKRCFIVANGPSIKNEKLDLLTGEYVITVNQMIRKKEFVDLSPILNVWADPVYFDETMPEEAKKVFADLFRRTCNCNDKIINIVPLYAKDYLYKNKLNTERVRYMDTSLYYYDGYAADFDLSKRMPYFYNIVQYATAIAVYMGFKEIYIIGCDSTGIITKINSVLSQNIESVYSYDLDKEGQRYVNYLFDHFTVEEQFDGWAKAFHFYDQLSMYCRKRNIKLINCSSQTIIQSVDRMTLEDVING